VEIGAWEGRSTVALANAIHPRVLHTCDTWQGDNNPVTEAIAVTRDVFAQWQVNVNALTKGNVVAHRMGWREFVPTITEPIALAFIDAAHSYREVYDNIVALIPKMTPGGVMCGDDAHHGPVQDAVFDMFGTENVGWVGSMWVFQIPTNPEDVYALRLRAINPDFSPSEGEWKLDLERVTRVWRSYVMQVSPLDHAAGLGVCAYLYRLCQSLQPKRILDLGSGVSSVIFRKWAATVTFDVEIVSVDTDPEWLEKTRTFIVDNEELDPTGLQLLDDGITGEFDLVFHDIANGEIRNRLAGVACEHLRPGGVIVFDDAHHMVHQRAYQDHAKRHGISCYTLEKLTTDAIGRWAILGVKDREPAPTPTSDLQSRYAQLCNTPSDIYLHLPRLVEMVIHGDARKVIELGTRTGVSTIAWLYALEQTGGHLWSVDTDSQPPIGDYPHWTFIQGDDESDAVLSQLPTEVDIVFVDTSHHYEHTLRELRLYRSQVRPGGLIVCHDTELPHPEGAPMSDPVYPVKTAIKEFVAENGFRWINYPECWGLGLIEVV
jgi:predicted O-methyltransferase YrrM